MYTMNISILSLIVYAIYLGIYYGFRTTAVSSISYIL